MKTALLFSIALSLFWIIFAGAQTRFDEAYYALAEVDTNLPGDIVLFAGVPIVVAALIGAGKAIRGAVKGLTDETTDKDSG